MIYYILSGLIGVINMILWGLFGDLLVEKFSFLKILRSISIGVLWSILLFLISPNLPLFIVSLVVISMERVTTEIYKALVRLEDQNKYKIPSDLNIKLNHKLKLFLGLFLISAIMVFLCLIEISINKINLIFIIGFFVALTGMLKDAPFEGFNLVKFFRSPIIAVIVGILLLTLFPAISGKYFLLATAGGERIISEFYKKIFRGRIPGKFKDKEFNKTWQNKRKLLLFIYGLNIIGLIILIFI
jgi:hypothetical protein